MDERLLHICIDTGPMSSVIIIGTTSIVAHVSDRRNDWGSLDDRWRPDVGESFLFQKSPRVQIRLMNGVGGGTRRKSPRAISVDPSWDMSLEVRRLRR